MKTALDLPDELMREIKIEAAKRGAKLKDLIAELLRAGLTSPRRPETRVARLTVEPCTGLPVVADTVPAVPSTELTPARIAEILQGQDEEWAIEAAR